MKRKKRMKAIEKEVLRNRKRSYCLEYMIAHSVHYLNRYDEGGLDALINRRLVQISHRRAPVNEVMWLI